MLENLQAVNVFSPTITEILLNILVSLLCGFFITLIYRIIYKGPGYSNSFVNSFMFLSVITTLVIMIIGNNLARAFGLVGALSIIRFRTAIKETIDIVFIFLALTIGMAAGVGYHKLAFAGTLVMGVILLVFSKSKGSLFLSKPYILQFVTSDGAADKESNPVDEVLLRECQTIEMINMRSNELDSTLEFSYYVRLKKNRTTMQLIHELQKVKGVRNVNFFFDQQNT